MSEFKVTRVVEKKYSIESLPKQCGEEVACPDIYRKHLRAYLKKQKRGENPSNFPILRNYNWVFRLENRDGRTVCIRYRDYDQIVRRKLEEFAPLLDYIKSRVGTMCDLRELPITADPYRQDLPFFTLGTGYIDLWVLDSATGVSTVLFKMARVHTESRPGLPRLSVCKKCKSLF